MGRNHDLSTKEVLFGFRGRIGRLTFLGWNLLIGLALVLTFGISMGAALRDDSTGMQLLGLAGMYVPWTLALWPGAALMAKRLQDIGLPGWHAFWITAIWYLPVFDVVP